MRKKRGYWDYKICKEEASKYNCRKDFYKSNVDAYNASIRNCWLDEICSNMTEGNKKWTKDECKIEAMKYNSRYDFYKGSNAAYAISGLKGWRDEICSHMELKGNRFFRYVYKATFPDNKIYIGLTYDLDKRKKAHLSGKSKSSIYNYKIESNNEPIFELISDLLHKNEASKLEKEKISYYRNSLGYSMVLNRHNGGGLGSHIKWNKEKCKEEALKYNSRYNFEKGNKSACTSARINGWMDEICSHMVLFRKPSSYWDFNRCEKEASKYENRTLFQKGNRSAYKSSRINKWLDTFYNPNKIIIK